MRELVFEELTTEQKLGMVMTAQCRNIEEGDFEFALDLIRRHALGAVWVLPGEGSEERMRAVHEAADYPILIARTRSERSRPSRPETWGTPWYATPWWT